MGKKSKGEPPLAVALTSDSAGINDFAAWLITLGAEVTVTKLSGRRSKLRAKVPQEHAPAVIAVISGGQVPGAAVGTLKSRDTGLRG